jgi:hypothetical protein
MWSLSVARLFVPAQFFEARQGEEARLVGLVHELPICRTSLS